MANVDLSSRVAQVEVDLISQEHRSIVVLVNAWNYAFGRVGDPRRSAARRALLYFLLVRPPTVALITGTGLSALVGLWLAWQANTLIKEQNRLLTTQNALAQSARVSGLATEVSSVFEALTKERERYDHVAALMRRDGIELQDRDFYPSQTLTNRIIALSFTLKPYNQLDASGTPLLIPLSPERARLLSTLLGSDVPFHEVVARGDFRNSDFRGVDLSYRDLRLADLRDSDFSEGNISYCCFRKCLLPNSDRFSGADMEGVDLRGAVVPTDDWLSKIDSLQSPPLGFSTRAWSLEPNETVMQELPSGPYTSYEVDKEGNERLGHLTAVSGIRMRKATTGFRLRNTEVMRCDVCDKSGREVDKGVDDNAVPLAPLFDQEESPAAVP